MKYELVPSDISGLFRVKAIKDFKGIKVGELGGYVQNPTNLSQNGNAWIYGSARVYGNATVGGNAEVGGSAYVYENVQIGGNAYVWGNTQVYGNAQVYDNARVYNNAQVFGNAIVCDSARVFGNARITQCLYVQQKKYSITATDTHCFIGCEGHTWKDWFVSIAQIGYRHNYTEQEIELTRQLLRILYQQITNWEAQ